MANKQQGFTGKRDVDDIVQQLVLVIREAGQSMSAEAIYEAVGYLAAKMTHDMEHSVPMLPASMRRSLALGTFLRVFLPHIERCNVICDAEQLAHQRRSQGKPDYDA